MSASAEKALGGDRFVLREHIGSGGMGEVFRALDRERGIEVALKLLRDPEPEKIYRFKREFRALSDVTHPHLVRLYELVSSGDRWFFTMELIDGIDFLSWVRGGREAWVGRAPTAPAHGPLTISGALEMPRPEGADDSTMTRPPEGMPKARRKRQSTGAPTLAGVRQPGALETDEQWARLREGL